MGINIKKCDHIQRDLKILQQYNRTTTVNDIILLHHPTVNEKQYNILVGAKTNDMQIERTVNVANLKEFGVKYLNISCEKVDSKVLNLVSKTTKQAVNIFERMMAGPLVKPKKKISRYIYSLILDIHFLSTCSILNCIPSVLHWAYTPIILASQSVG